MKTSRILCVCCATLLLRPFNVLAVTDTWDGGGVNNLLTLDDNWVDNTAPVSDLANTDLIFAGVIRLMPALNASFSTRSITFNNTAGAFVIGGQTFVVGAGGIVNNDSQTMTFSNPVRFSSVATSTIDASAGGLTFTGTVTLPTDTLTVTGGSATSFANISGFSAFTKSGAGTMTWTPTAPTNCNVTISTGTLTMGADGGADTFNSGATIAVNGTSTFNTNESLTLDGAQFTRASGANVNIAAGKTLTIQGGGDAIFTGLYSQSTAANIIVTGAGSTFHATGNFNPAGGSTTTVSAGGSAGSSGGGQVNIANFSAAGDATVTVDGAGSSLSGPNGLSVGLNGNTGSLTFSNSSTGTFGFILLGIGAGGSSGTFNIQSGAGVTGTDLLLIATTTGADDGIITITGPGSSLTLNGAATATIGAANTSTGVLNVNSSGTFNSGTGLTTVNATGAISITDGVYNSNGNLTINGGLLSRNAGGTLSLDPGTTLTIQNGGDVAIAGTFVVNAAANIAVTGAGSTISTTNTTAFIGGSTLNVSGGGQVSSGTFPLAIGTSGNGTATVDGAGSSLAGGTLSVGHNGATGSLVFTNGSTGTFGAINLANLGLTAGTSGTLSIQSGASVSATGLEITPTSFPSTGLVTVSGAGSVLTLTGAASAGIGRSSGTSPGTLQVQSGGTFNSGTSVTIVRATGTVAITGGIYNSNGNLTLTGGQLTRDATGVFTLASGRTLTVQSGGDVLITGAYNAGTNTTLAVSGAGSTFSATQNLQLNNGSVTNVSAGGSISGGGANIGQAVGNGTVTVDGAGSSLSSTGNATLGQNNFTGSLTFSNGSSGSFFGMSVGSSINPNSVGILNIQSGATVTSGSLNVANQLTTNSGAVTITGAGSALTLTGAATIGAASDSTATVTVGSGSTFTTGTGLTTVSATGALNVNAGGTLSGPADFTGTGQVNIAGAYVPGTASGVNQTTSASFAQNMTFQPTTSITMELGGLTAGTQHDQLVFNGPGATHITWNGTLNVELVLGFVPQAGNAFDLFNFDPARDAGTFTTVNLPALPNGLFWRTDQLYVDGTIQVSLVPNTYAEWQSAFGVGAFDEDDDQDGVTNGLEFLLGTNPNTPGAAPLEELPPSFPDHIVASVRFSIPTTPASEAHYRVYGSPDLANWTLLASKDGSGAWVTIPSTTVMEGTAANGHIPITISETLATGTAHRFHRLEGEAP